MAAATSINIQRTSPQEPWGFRLQGGSDYRMALRVKKVEAGSPCDRYLSAGDLILGIAGHTTQGMSHSQAHNMIKGAGMALQLHVQKSSTNFDAIKPKGPVKFSPWKH